MTLGDLSDKQSEYAGNMTKLSLALKDTLQAAQEQGRVTCGIYATATMLEACPDHVMLCILPVMSCGVVEKDIHCTLIEAFCSENDVRLIKVDSSERLAKLLGETKPVNDNDFVTGRRCSPGSVDCSCVLVLYPEDGDVSDMEKMILYYYKTTCEDEPHPYIPLPA